MKWEIAWLRHLWWPMRWFIECHNLAAYRVSLFDQWHRVHCQNADLSGGPWWAHWMKQHQSFQQSAAGTSNIHHVGLGERMEWSSTYHSSNPQVQVVRHNFLDFIVVALKLRTVHSKFQYSIFGINRFIYNIQCLTACPTTKVPTITAHHPSQQLDWKNDSGIPPSKCPPNLHKHQNVHNYNIMDLYRQVWLISQINQPMQIPTSFALPNHRKHTTWMVSTKHKCVMLQNTRPWKNGNNEINNLTRNRLTKFQNKNERKYSSPTKQSL